MRKFSHIGIPTTEVKENESFMEGGKIHLTDFNTSANKIEWLRFAPDSPMPELLKEQTHIAWMVDSLEEAMKGQEVLLEPFDAAENLRVAFIVEEGIPVELMEETK